MFVFLIFLTFKFWFHYLFLHFGTPLSIWENQIEEFYHWPIWEISGYHGIFYCS